MGGRGSGRPVGYRATPDAEYKSPYRKRRGIHEARVIVEQRTGIRLPAKSVIHHYDPADKVTSEGPLVVCENQAYHAAIEYRGRALRECGNVNWLRCMRCGRWDDPKNLLVSERYQRPGHRYVVHQQRKGVCVELCRPHIRRRREDGK